jgi:hypothetical protein
MTTLLETTRQLLLVSFMALPLMLICYTFFLGFGLGNSGLIILFFGQIVLVPLVTMLSQMFTGNLGTLFSVTNHDICNLVPSSVVRGGFLNVGPSFWIAHLVFFITYLVSNALFLYKIPPYEGADSEKIANRQNQVVTAAIVTILLTVLFIYLRVQTGCETTMGAIVAAATMVPLGVGWYYFAQICGIGNADIFGIAAGVLSPSAGANATQVCVSKQN